MTLFSAIWRRLHDLTRGYRLLLMFVVAGLVAIDVDAQFAERVDVAIANVDVVVTDRKGNAVRGLTREDFEVFEDGRRQAITNFAVFDRLHSSSASAELAGSVANAPSRPRPRVVILYIDIDDISRMSRRRFFDAVRTFMIAAVREGDVAAVLQWNVDRVRVAVPPSSDRSQLLGILNALAEPASWSSNDLTQRMHELRMQQAVLDKSFADAIGKGVPDVRDPVAERQFQEWVSGEERCQRSRRKIAAVTSLLSTFSRIDGQKVMVYASDDSSTRPLRDCLLFRSFEQVAETANASGFTIHTIHPSGNRDARHDRFPQRGASAADGEEYLRTFDEASGLSVIAARTGGHAAIGPGQGSAVLQQAIEELETYYSIGYRLSEGKEDIPRKLKVTMRNRSYRVRARQTVTRLSDASNIRAEVVSNLYFSQPRTTEPVMFDVRVDTVTRDGRYLLVHVELRIRVADLLLLPSTETAKRGSFTVFVAAGRELGDASEVAERTQNFERHAAAEGDTIRYTFVTRVRPDTRVLSIAVRDNPSAQISTKRIPLPSHLVQSR